MDININADKPIKNKKQDKFNRSTFAMNIAIALTERVDKSCLVLGIHGEWGEGKTSVINIIKDRLANDSKTVVFEFNPWRYEEEDAILALFYRELAGSIGETVQKKFQDICDKYLPSIADLAGALSLGTIGNALNGIHNLIPTHEIIDFKETVEEAIKKSGKNIVVIFDDLDRLEHKEILRVLKLIKLNADLENVTYIVAYDRDIVAQSINNDIKKGQKFLEKIIQVQVDLPKARSSDLFELLFTELSFIFNTMENSQCENFKVTFRELFKYALKNPRQISKLANNLYMSSKFLDGEVDIKDLIILEATKIFYLDLYNKIKNDSEIFFESTSMSGRINSDRQNEVDLINFKSFLDQYNLNDKNSISDIVKYLFPTMQYLYYENNGRGVLRSSDTFKRLSSPRYFDRYFSYSVDKVDVSDKEVEGLIGNLLEFSEFKNFFLKLSYKKKKIFLQKLNDKNELINNDKKKTIINNILNMQYLFQIEQDYTYHAANLIAEMLVYLEKDEIINIFNNIIKMQNLHLKVQTLSYLLNKGTMGTMIANPSLKSEFLNELIVIVFDHFNELDLLTEIRKSRNSLIDILHVLLHVDQNSYNSFLNKQFRNSLDFIIKIFSEFGIVEPEGQIDMVHYERLSQYIFDKDYVFNLLKEKYDKKDLDANIKNFIHIHQQKVNTQRFLNGENVN